jgi:hypothetical protein
MRMSLTQNRTARVQDGKELLAGRNKMSRFNILAMLLLVSRPFTSCGGALVPAMFSLQELMAPPWKDDTAEALRVAVRDEGVFAINYGEEGLRGHLK